MERTREQRRRANNDGVVCAWCGRRRVGDSWLLGYDHGDADPETSVANTPAGAGISHGICPDCETKFNADLDRQEVSP